MCHNFFASQISSVKKQNKTVYCSGKYKAEKLLLFLNISENVIYVLDCNKTYG